MVLFIDLLIGVKRSGSNRWSAHSRYNAVLPSTESAPRWCQPVSGLVRCRRHLQVPHRVPFRFWRHHQDGALYGRSLVARHTRLRTYVFSAICLSRLATIVSISIIQDQWLKWKIRGGGTVHSSFWAPCLRLWTPSLQSGPQAMLGLNQHSTSDFFLLHFSFES